MEAGLHLVLIYSCKNTYVNQRGRSLRWKNYLLKELNLLKFNFSKNLRTKLDEQLNLLEFNFSSGLRTRL